MNVIYLIIVAVTLSIGFSLQFNKLRERIFNIEDALKTIERSLDEIATTLNKVHDSILLRNNEP